MKTALALSFGFHMFVKKMCILERKTTPDAQMTRFIELVLLEPKLFHKSRK